MNYVLLLLAIGYAFFEGIREYFFYTINRKGGFPDIKTDKSRKLVNAVLFTLVFITPALELGFHIWKILGLILCIWTLRWIVLDGILALMRGAHFFYVGTVAGTDVAIQRISNFIGVPPELTMAASKLICLAVFATFYVLQFV